MKGKSMLKRALFLKNITFILIPAIFIIYACSSSNETSPASNIPTDHTVNEKGTMHKPGLNNPTVNCISCHGSDLKGGSAGKSCYSCHGQKW
jgi:hypothetical protein